MAAVLLMVGRGQEDPGIVAHLLDLQASPTKPQYAMAAEVCMGNMFHINICMLVPHTNTDTPHLFYSHLFPHQEPLLLYACGFDALRFRRTERAAQANETAVVSMIERDLVASAMASAIITRMHSDDKVSAQPTWGTVLQLAWGVHSLPLLPL